MEKKVLYVTMINRVEGYDEIPASNMKAENILMTSERPRFVLKFLFYAEINTVVIGYGISTSRQLGIATHAELQKASEIKGGAEFALEKVSGAGMVSKDATVITGWVSTSLNITTPDELRPIIREILEITKKDDLQ